MLLGFVLCIAVAAAMSWCRLLSDGRRARSERDNDLLDESEFHAAMRRTRVVDAVNAGDTLRGEKDRAACELIYGAPILTSARPMTKQEQDSVAEYYLSHGWTPPAMENADKDTKRVEVVE